MATLSRSHISPDIQNSMPDARWRASETTRRVNQPSSCLSTYIQSSFVVPLVVPLVESPRPWLKSVLSKYTVRHLRAVALIFSVVPTNISAPLTKPVLAFCANVHTRVWCELSRTSQLKRLSICVSTTYCVGALLAQHQPPPQVPPLSPSAPLHAAPLAPVLPTLTLCQFQHLRSHDQHSQHR